MTKAGRYSGAKSPATGKQAHGGRRESWCEVRLSRGLEAKLRKMGLGDVVRDFRRGLAGKSAIQREMDRLVPSTAKLNEMFRSAAPRVGPELFAQIVTACWESVYFALLLAEHLKDIIDAKDRFARKDLRHALALIYNGPIAGQLDQVRLLRRDIPRLVEKLGGDPSQELILPTRRLKHS